MKIKASEVTGLEFEYVYGKRRPHNVSIWANGQCLTTAGSTLSEALVRAFKESGMWPNDQYPYPNKDDLARYLFWQFEPSKNWHLAISALERQE